MIAEGIRHRGFSFIQVLSPCVTFNKVATYDYYKERVKPVPETHRADDLVDAMRLAADTETFHLGLFFRTERPEYTDSLERVGRNLTGPPVDVEALMRKFS
jgi:2-oxoglutarate ferredoxin oxidoreductase subunit beta